MGKKSADEFFQRLATDEAFAAMVADHEHIEENQTRILEEYDLDETKMVRAFTSCFELPDEVLDEISGGLLSDLSFRKVLGFAISGGMTGFALSYKGGPKAALVGTLSGAAIVVGAEVFKEACDSLAHWKW